MLRDFVAGMPHGWQPIQESDERVSVAFWDTEEWEAYTAHAAAEGDAREVVWALPSYTRAFWMLWAMLNGAWPWSPTIRRSCGPKASSSSRLAALKTRSAASCVRQRPGHGRLRRSGPRRSCRPRKP